MQPHESLLKDTKFAKNNVKNVKYTGKNKSDLK